MGSHDAFSIRNVVARNLQAPTTGLQSTMRALSSLCLVALSACATSGSGAVSPHSDISAPVVANYACGDGTELTIENRGVSVVVTGAGGEFIELPASPAESRARYGTGAYALVLEDGEALWMQAGKEPETCLR